MNRRGFIRISSVAAIPILLGMFPGKRRKKTSSYDIIVHSNSSFGHRVRKAINKAPSSTENVDILIVGGGVAGISAAYQLRDQNTLLLEANANLGGSSSASSWKDVRFSHGAHYDLAYPKTYGKEVLKVLQELDIIEFNEKSDLYEFIERSHVIPDNRIEHCFENQQLRENVLGDVDGIEEFYKILSDYEGFMHLPTRLIDRNFDHLNHLSFETFLKEKMNLKPELSRRISYQMLDDWGGSIGQVSALAGIHYYTCRPYNTKDVELFSPPQGNYYFIEKMLSEISLEKVRTNALVFSVENLSDRVVTKYLNRDNEVKELVAKKVIYAGQKHALKYLFKGLDYDAFSNNTYAPWIVINIICAKGKLPFDNWQNDVVSKDLTFLGFTNSSYKGLTDLKHDVLTSYFCFPKEDRNKLLQFEESPEELADHVIELIEKETKVNFREYVKAVDIKLMGHAMAIPTPGFLKLGDLPEPFGNVHFAGVDTGRLPLFFEACDSGIMAANAVRTDLNVLS